MGTKLGLVGLGMIATMGLSASAALAADLTFSVDTNVSVNGNNYIIGSGSGATSVVVGDTTLTVVVPVSTTFTLISRNSHTLANDGGLTAVCTGTESTLTISAASTVVITPSISSCGPSGGGSYVAPATSATPAVPAVTPAVPATPATPATPAVLKALPFPVAKTTVEMQANLTVLLENLAVLQASQKASVASPVAGASVPSTGSYKANIVPGSKGNSVTALQNFLKSQGADIYPQGLVTGFYGNLTKAAVGRFQMKQGIVTSVSDAGYGNVGPKTRAKINSLLGL